MQKDSRYYRLIQSRQWQVLRRRKLTAQPLCECCLRSGIYRAATEVHHIEPVESAVTLDDMSRLCFGWSNLMSLCHDCHQSEHRSMRSRSRAKVRERNDARTARFIDAYLTPADRAASGDRGDGFLSDPASAPNPLPKSREKFSVLKNPVGGEPARLKNL